MAQATSDDTHERLNRYFDQINGLVTHGKLRTSKKRDDEGRMIARALTLGVLRGLDGKSKASVITYLVDLKLISNDGLFVDLSGADLSEADFSGAFLVNVCFHKADLSRANFTNSYLLDADMTFAIVNGVNFDGAVLQRARFTAYELIDAGIDPIEFRDKYNALVSRPD